MKRVLEKRSEKAEAAPTSTSFLERAADWGELTLTLCRVVVLVAILFSIYDVSSNVARKERSGEFLAATGPATGPARLRSPRRGAWATTITSWRGLTKRTAITTARRSV